MPLLKDGRLLDDPWVALGEDEPAPESGAIIVSLDRWQTERETLLNRNEPLGIRLASDQPPALIEQDLGQLTLVALEFPVFADGRAYSYARLLRERFAFTGEIRAVGNILRDQFLFLARCGFDAFEVRDENAVEGWLAAMSEFSVFYQPASDRRMTALALRHQRAAAE